MINRGSEWRRWEPHIHGPTTIMNNQFGGSGSWDDYLSALEAARPTIEAVAITDYYVTDTYERMLVERASGRLQFVQLIFPNVELRLDVATARGSFVNMHLLVSPEDSDHIAQLQRLLARLQFRAFGDRFDCTRSDLVRLGQRADPTIINEETALGHGANQFKVNFCELRDVMDGSDWAKKNILIAVAGGATDGSAGVRGAADKTIREEIERFADVIFASSAAQREFWLGERTLDRDQIRARYVGLKPCLHGSDAHKLADVALPFGDRFSWIKGGLEFDTLRQACIDPGGRAFIGSEPPRSATPSQVIAELRIDGAPWAQTPIIHLNPGLVAIIGARGSGKTALADMIAAGCDAISEDAGEQGFRSSASFLVRARSLLSTAEIELTWAAGHKSAKALNGSSANNSMSYPRARYLSQQFVENLCSSGGLSDGLLQEIERVIFEAHPFGDREGAVDFAELLEHRAARHRLARDREVEAVTQISERIGSELEKERMVDAYNSQVAQKRQLIADYTADRARLVPTGGEAWVARHNQVTAAVEKLRAKIKGYTNQRQTFVAMQDEVMGLRRTQAPEMLRQMQARYPNNGMDSEQWTHFLLDYKGSVDSNLAGYVVWIDGEVAKLKGVPPTIDGTKPYFADDADLNLLPRSLLEAEQVRLEMLMSADKETSRQYGALTNKLTTETAALEGLNDKLKDACGAKDRARELQHERETAYERVFDAIIAEQSVLDQLYQPLMERLATESGTLRKLSLSVTRVADVQKWAADAEEVLLDRRKGSLRGVGTLVQRAQEVLRSPWETGSAADVTAAMTDFRRRNQEDLLGYAPPRTEQAEFRAWSKRFAHWLFSTDHIQVRYGIEYDGVDIRKLSPGTRGIVLLLLYLALDDEDDRPLIIDQPEENLDPKSVFDELVKLFILAKQKRQVIVVTHNANLVVNTDADQIIIANAGPHRPGELPPISYTSGGLENAEIRKSVCDILEGGEAAFQERARRLRVHLYR